LSDVTTFVRRTLHGRRDLLAPAAAFPARYPGLLQSVTHGTPQARYDILFAFPQETLSLLADGRLIDGRGLAQEGRFLEALDHAWRDARAPRDASSDLPFHGGWLLLMRLRRETAAWREDPDVHQLMQITLGRLRELMIGGAHRDFETEIEVALLAYEDVAMRPVNIVRSLATLSVTALEVASGDRFSKNVLRDLELD